MMTPEEVTRMRERAKRLEKDEIAAGMVLQLCDEVEGLCEMLRKRKAMGIELGFSERLGAHNLLEIVETRRENRRHRKMIGRLMRENAKMRKALQ